MSPDVEQRVHAWLVSQAPRDVPAALADRVAAIPVVRHRTATSRSSRIAAVAAAVAVITLGAGGLLLSVGTGPTRDPGVAALPSPGTSIVTTPAATGRGVVRADWRNASYPDSGSRQNARTLWSDGSVALASVRDGEGELIWASTDGGASWQQAELRDLDGRRLGPAVSGTFSFSTDGTTFYAIPREAHRSSPTRTNQAVLVSSDGLHWQMAGRRRHLSADLDMYGVADRGLLAGGAIGTLDADGLYQRGWITGRESVRSHGQDVRSAPALLTSTDGVTWTVSTVLPLEANEQGIATLPLVGAEGSLLVMGDVATSNRDNRLAMWRSSDDGMFQRVTTGPVADASTHRGRVALSSGAYHGGFFIQTYDSLDGQPDAYDDRGHGNLVTTLWTTPDGITWERHEAPAGIDLVGAVPIDGGILTLAMAPEGDIAGRLLDSDGRWIDVPGDPFPDVESAVQTGPGSVSLSLATVVGRGEPVIVTGTIEMVAP